MQSFVLHSPVFRFKTDDEAHCAGYLSIRFWHSPPLNCLLSNVFTHSMNLHTSFFEQSFPSFNLSKLSVWLLNLKLALVALIIFSINNFRFDSLRSVNKNSGKNNLQSQLLLFHRNLILGLCLWCRHPRLLPPPFLRLFNLPVCDALKFGLFSIDVCNQYGINFFWSFRYLSHATFGAKFVNYEKFEYNFPAITFPTTFHRAIH